MQCNPDYPQTIPREETMMIHNVQKLMLHVVEPQPSVILIIPESSNALVRTCKEWQGRRQGGSPLPGNPPPLQ